MSQHVEVENKLDKLFGGKEQYYDDFIDIPVTHEYDVELKENLRAMNENETIQKLDKLYGFDNLKNIVKEALVSCSDKNLEEYQRKIILLSRITVTEPSLPLTDSLRSIVSEAKNLDKTIIEKKPSVRFSVSTFSGLNGVNAAKNDTKNNQK